MMGSWIQLIKKFSGKDQDDDPQTPSHDLGKEVNNRVRNIHFTEFANQKKEYDNQGGSRCTGHDKRQREEQQYATWRLPHCC